MNSQTFRGELPRPYGLAVLPATPELAGADVSLAGEIGGESMLRTALDSVSDDFDLVVLDCPPSLGLVTINALVAADGVLVPVTAATRASG